MKPQLNLSIWQLIYQHFTRQLPKPFASGSYSNFRNQQSNSMLFELSNSVNSRKSLFNGIRIHSLLKFQNYANSLLWSHPNVLGRIGFVCFFKRLENADYFLHNLILHSPRQLRARYLHSPAMLQRVSMRSLTATRCPRRRAPAHHQRQTIWNPTVTHRRSAAIAR